MSTNITSATTVSTSELTTSTSVASPKINLFLPEDLREGDSQVGSQGYAAILKLAMSGNKAAKSDLLPKYLQAQRAEAALAVSRAEENLAQDLKDGKSRSPRDPNVAKFRLVLQYWDALTDQLALIGTKKGTEKEWEPFADHRILSEGYIGTLSTMDKIRLIIGRSVENERGNTRQLRGIASLEYPGYATISVNESGYLLHLDGKAIPMTGEELHRLLVQQVSFQRIPFDQQCVMATDSKTSINLNGISVILPADVFFTSLGEQHQLHSKMRVSMPFHFYRFLVWALIPSHHGKHAPELDELDAILIQCFGESRAPENAVELEYAHTMTWYPKMSASRRAQSFKQGRLKGLTPQDLTSLDAFTIGTQRVQVEKLAKAQAQAEPFQEPVGDDLV